MSQQKKVKAPEIKSGIKPGIKSEAKKTVCKEYDCKEAAKVNGYCRLHFLRIVKAHHDESVLEDSVDAEKGSRDRRKNSRFDTPQNTNSTETEPLIAAVESLGLLDTDITQITVVEELDPSMAPPTKTKKAA